MTIHTSIIGGNTAAAQTFQVERVSIASNGAQANNVSFNPSISADGRFVAYASAASNLVAGDTNATQDIFVFDRKTETTERVSVASNGTEANNGSFNDEPSLSANGHFVTYTSDASNLVPGDTNGASDVFVFDRRTRMTERVSVASDHTQGDSISLQPAISADGRFVTYTSDASNLVVGDTNGASDVFVFDRETDTAERVSVASDGTEANNGSFSDDPSLSADGRFVAYTSTASNLVPGDTNGARDIFVFDRQTDTTTRVSVTNDGSEGTGDFGSYDPEISADGRFVAYSSDATNLVSGDTNNSVDVFVFDRQSNTTERVSVTSDGAEGNGFSGGSTISADGRYVAYTSDASNLVPGDTNDTADIFLFDRQTNTTSRLSVSGPESAPSISADGRYVAFTSNAANSVPGDTNGFPDVFVVQTTVAPPVDGVVKDGDEGNNLLKGTRRDDILRGHGGKDWLFGLKGDDSMDGGGGKDKISAGKGDDTVLGGTGHDRIWTGAGSDVVVFSEWDGHDWVFDFDHRVDRVQLDVNIGTNAIDDFAELEALVARGDIGLSTQRCSLTLTFDKGDALMLRGLRDLSADDWLFT